MKRARSWTWPVAMACAVLLAGLAGSASAGDEGGLLVDLGNAKCPIMGKEVSGKNYVDWNGLRVSLCCGGCVKKLLADPEAKLDAAGIEWREAADMVAKANAATGADRAKLVAALAAKWKLVGDVEAAPAPEAPVAPTGAKEWVVDLGNANCPITGEEVDGSTFTVWNGVRIGECCPGCTGKLLADPEAVLAKAGIEWQRGARFASRLNNASEADRKKLVEAAGDSMKVVEVEAGPVVDLGNAKCPIMGGAVDGKTFTVWNGVRVGHCCPGCQARLLAAPEKALEKAGIEWREAAKAVAAVRNATGDARAKLLAELKEKYDVVGE